MSQFAVQARSLVSRLFAPRESRAAFGGGSTYVPGMGTLAGITVTPQTALTFTAAFAAINVLSTDLASLPRGVYRRLPDGTEVPAFDTPQHKLISVAPNGEQSGFRFRQHLNGHVHGWGNGYAEIVRDQYTGDPVALWPLHPATTKPERTASKQLIYRIDEGRKAPLLAEDVLHLAGLGFDGIQGYCPVTLAQEAIGLGKGAEQFGSAFFGNGAISGGILEFPKRLSEQASKNLRESFERVHQGTQNAHRVAVLEEGATWKATQIPPEAAQFLATRNFQVLEIARMWRIPPHKLGDYSQSHLANLEESNLDYLQTTLLGWVVMEEAELNAKLFSEADRESGLFVKTDMTAMSRGNMGARVAFYQGLRNMGAITSNEIRTREGFNPIGKADGGDLVIVQGQYVPLSQVGKAPPAAPPQVEPRSIRFNPHHDGVGKFSSGHGGGRVVHAAGKSVPEQEFHDHVASAAQMHKADLRFAVRSPSTDKGRELSAAAEAKGKYLISETRTPKYTTDQTGPYHYHRVEDRLQAVTFPASRTPHKPRDPSDKDWISRTFKFDIDSPHTDYQVPDDSRFRTRRLALKHSRKLALEAVEHGTSRRAVMTSDFEKTVHTAAANGVPAAHGHTTFHLIVPAAEKQQSGKFSLEAQSAHGAKKTAFQSAGGKTHNLFDMKKDDLPGQTSFLRSRVLKNGDVRYNPYHGPDGKFSGAHGGGKHGKIVLNKKAPKKATGVAAAATSAPARDFAGAEHKDVKAHHAVMSADWAKGLSTKESGAVQGYSSSLYQEINGLHRHDKVSAGYDKASMRSISASMDKALDRASLKEPTTVYRGVSSIKALGLDPKSLVGGVIHDKAYLSTSLTPKIAERFTSKSKDGAVLRIKAPAGSKGASVAGLTNRKDEHEVLFHRGSKVRITGHSTDARGRTVLDAELSH